MNAASPQPVFRFAPTPNGRLHLGHAYSALLNAQMAGAVGGRFLLRIEDTDAARCKPEYEAAILEDLDWLGLVFEPPRRQSEHIGEYQCTLEALDARGLIYPCFCTRGEIERANAGLRDPDGSPLHRAACRAMSDAEVQARQSAGERAAMRLDMARALSSIGGALTWREYGEGARALIVEADPAAWGDVVVRGKERPASYHLAVVVDDAGQAISDVVRGRDLYHATSVHRLLQDLLGLEPPIYRHHRLVRDATGARMSKSAQSQPLSVLRERGFTASDIRAALGFGDKSRARRLAVTIS